MEYEYKVYRNPPEQFGNRTNEDIAKSLNFEYDKGWELVTMCQDGYGKILMVFKCQVRWSDKDE